MHKCKTIFQLGNRDVFQLDDMAMQAMFKLAEIQAILQLGNGACFRLGDTEMQDMLELENTEMQSVFQQGYRIIFLLGNTVSHV